MAESPDRSPIRTKPNYFYSIVSVTLVLFLLGFFALLLLQAQRLVTLFKERVNIIVELREAASPEQIAELRQQLQSSPFTKQGSIAFTSREDAAGIMQHEFGEDFLKLDLPNPFFDVLSFNVKARYMEADSLQAIRSLLREHDYVNDVFYQESLIDNIAANVHRIGYFALGIGFFFILVAIALIHNTIRLALYANRFLIKNMELVGASWEFISRPYLLRAVAHGALSGLLAVGILSGLIWLTQYRLPELQLLQNISGTLLLFVVLLALGILMTTLSTYYVVNKYLKMRIDDLY